MRVCLNAARNNWLRQPPSSHTFLRSCCAFVAQIFYLIASGAGERLKGPLRGVCGRQMIRHDSVGKYFRFTRRPICWLIELKLQFYADFLWSDGECWQSIRRIFMWNFMVENIGVWKFDQMRLYVELKWIVMNRYWVKFDFIVICNNYLGLIFGMFSNEWKLKWALVKWRERSKWGIRPRGTNRLPWQFLNLSFSLKASGTAKFKW